MSTPLMQRSTLIPYLCASALLFPSIVWAGAGDDGVLKLNMSDAIRSRMFWNVQHISAKTKTKSEEPRDITPGGVVKISDLQALVQDITDNKADPDCGDLAGCKWYVKQLAYTQATAALAGAIADDYAKGFVNSGDSLGTPKGILAKSGDPSKTLALSLGYYLDDEHHWAVEALVLGAPVDVAVYGDGVRVRSDGKKVPTYTLEPNELAGKTVLTTKMIPPILKFGYNIGDKSWFVRPYVGVAGMYAVFFDAKTTSYFDAYQGGKTSLSLKNAVGVGPMIGLNTSNVGDSGWNIGFSVGSIRLKTEATLITRGTIITSDSLVTNDYGPKTVGAIKNTGEVQLKTAAQVQLAQADQYPGATIFENGFTTELMKDLAAYKKAAGTGDGTLGTFVRKQKTTLDNTLLMLTVGRSF